MVNFGGWDMPVKYGTSINDEVGLCSDCILLARILLARLVPPCCSSF